MSKLTGAAVDVAALAVLTAYGPRLMTSVIRSYINSRWRSHETTARVLRALKRLEKEGLVHRARTGYVNQLCWSKS